MTVFLLCSQKIMTERDLTHKVGFADRLR